MAWQYSNERASVGQRAGGSASRIDLREAIQHFAGDLSAALVVLLGFLGGTIERFGIVVRKGDAHRRTRNQWAGLVRLRTGHDRAKALLGVGACVIDLGEA